MKRSKNKILRLLRDIKKKNTQFILTHLNTL